MHDADGVLEALDAGLEQRELLGVAEAERLNELGLGDAEELSLLETRIERLQDTVRVVHVFGYGAQQARLLTEPFEGYGGDD